MQMEGQTVKILISLLLEEQSDLGLHFLHRHTCICQITEDIEVCVYILARDDVTSF